jgi:nucleotide-binding universal stress UspA family protein
MRVVVWTAETGWEACVDTAALLVPADAEILLLAVPSAELEEVHAGGRAGLLGRRPPPPRGPRWEEVSDEAAEALLADALERLGRDAATEVRHGRVEREVVAACDGADLLVCARDGDDERLGPKSLGKHARFVVDHAPCRVLLVWPGEPPGTDRLPPPPPHEREGYVPPHEREGHVPPHEREGDHPPPPPHER